MKVRKKTETEEDLLDGCIFDECVQKMIFDTEVNTPESVASIVGFVQSLKGVAVRESTLNESKNED